MKPRRKKDESFYNFENYGVVLEKLKTNTTYGAPRFKAFIFSLKNGVRISGRASVYTFTGHYYMEVQEAREILAYHLKENN